MSGHELQSRSRLVSSAFATAGVAVIAVSLWRKRGKNYLRNLSRSCQHLICLKSFKVSVVSSSLEWNNIDPSFWKSVKSSGVVGLDCEWVSRGIGEKENPVALVQISSHLGHCTLVRLCMLDKIPTSLRELLYDEKVVKCGVGVLDDARRLARDYGISVNGCLDLRHLVLGHVRQEILQKKMGLAGLAEELLKISLQKDFKVKCSKWDSSKLTASQIEYASLDAFISVPILCELVNDTYVTMASNRFLPLSSVETWNFVREIVDPFVDVNYKHKGTVRDPSSSSTETATVSYKKSNIKVSALKDASRGFTPRRGPLYSNCFMEAPDGEILCTCDFKKAVWYLDRGIALKVKDDPFTVRLKFEPSGRPTGECDQYYQTAKENCCVVCGKAESYVRKNIIPQEYRKHFPEVMKNHQSHDVLLLCTVCHRISNSHDLSLRMDLAEECGAPIGTEENVKMRDDFELKKVISAARAISCSKARIPAQRMMELKGYVAEYYGVDIMTEDVLEKALKLESRILNDSYIPHGQKVISEYEKKGGLVLLERRWRQHFLETMKPKFLPALWSVDHNKDRLNNRILQNRVDILDYTIAVKGRDLTV